MSRRPFSPSSVSSSPSFSPRRSSCRCFYLFIFEQVFAFLFPQFTPSDTFLVCFCIILAFSWRFAISTIFYFYSELPRLASTYRPLPLGEQTEHCPWLKNKRILSLIFSLKATAPSRTATSTGRATALPDLSVAISTLSPALRSK